LVWAELKRLLRDVENHLTDKIERRLEWIGSQELHSHKALTRTLGIGCNPVLIKGDNEQFFDWLSRSVESEAVKFPPENGPIRWANLSRQDVFRSAS
jgi:hypothetical protein